MFVDFKSNYNIQEIFHNLEKIHKSNKIRLSIKKMKNRKMR